MSDLIDRGLAPQAGVALTRRYAQFRLRDNANPIANSGNVGAASASFSGNFTGVWANLPRYTGNDTAYVQVDDDAAGGLFTCCSPAAAPAGGVLILARPYTTAAAGTEETIVGHSPFDSTVGGWELYIANGLSDVGLRIRKPGGGTHNCTLSSAMRVGQPAAVLGYIDVANHNLQVMATQGTRTVSGTLAWSGSTPQCNPVSKLTLFRRDGDAATSYILSANHRIAQVQVHQCLTDMSSHLTDILAQWAGGADVPALLRG